MDKNATKCQDFFNHLAEHFKGTHVIKSSCNMDLSKYLVPFGTENQVTYYSKPDNSFRVSDHWNWKANLNRNKDEHYIQCYTRDLPWTKKRQGEGLASMPIRANCVCYFGPDNLYHVIYGEIFDRKTKTWRWLENTIPQAEFMINQIKMEAKRKSND